MDIDAFHLPISSSQALEALIVFSAFDFFRYMRGAMKTIAVDAEAKGGPVKKETMPIVGRIVTPIHALATFVPPAVYIGTLVYNGLQQPKWMTEFSLSDEIAGVQLYPIAKCALRIGACVAGIGLRKLTDSAFYHLGEQWHSLGRRERPRVVQTGPYAWVRHPLYSMVLLQEGVWSIMFWSYVPLFSLGITAAAFAVKMPIEEDMIQRDDGIRDIYREYKKKVPWRMVPYIW